MTRRRRGGGWPSWLSFTRKSQPPATAAAKPFSYGLGMMNKYYFQLYELIVNPYNRIDQVNFSQKCNELLKLIQDDPNNTHGTPIKEQLRGLIDHILKVPVKTTLQQIQHTLK